MHGVRSSPNSIICSMDSQGFAANFQGRLPECNIINLNNCPNKEDLKDREKLEQEREKLAKLAKDLESQIDQKEYPNELIQTKSALTGI